MRSRVALITLLLLALLTWPQSIVHAKSLQVVHLSSLAEGLYAPLRIATDDGGRMYVTEPQRHRVAILNASGRVQKYLYGIQRPLGIAVDHRGRIYVGDRHTGSVVIFDQQGRRLGMLGSGAGQFMMPSDIVVDAQNRIYVVDSKENQVKVFDANGALQSQFGNGILEFPTGIALDESRQALLVGQYGSVRNGKNAARIHIFDLQGRWQGSLGRYGAKPGEFTRIQGLAVDPQGRIFVTDCFQSVVQVVDYTGKSLGFIGGYGDQPGQFQLPSDVVLDRQQRLWVTSPGKRQLDVFSVAPLSPSGEEPNGRFTFELRQGLNLIAVPRKPSQDWRLSDLVNHIGRDAVASVFAFIPQTQRFATYLPPFEENSPANVPVTGDAAYFILMKESRQVSFEGSAWPGEVALRSGFNLFALPRQPSTEWNLADLAAFIGDGLVYLIAYDPGRRRCLVYTPGTDDNTGQMRVQGGVGYVAIMSQTKTLTFEGSAWMNSSVATAPAKAWDFQPGTGVPVLIVAGTVRHGSAGTTLRGIRLEITNERTGKTKMVTSDAEGRYVGILTDFVGNDAAREEDVIRVRPMTSGDYASSLEYSVRLEDLVAGQVRIPPLWLEDVPDKTVSLPSYPNPANPEVWIPFRLSQDSDVTIKIYDVQGRLVRTLALGRKPAGNYVRPEQAAHWDGKNDAGERVTSGIYFYTLIAGSQQTVRRMVILK